MADWVVVNSSTTTSDDGYDDSEASSSYTSTWASFLWPSSALASGSASASGGDTRQEPNIASSVDGEFVVLSEPSVDDVSFPATLDSAVAFTPAGSVSPENEEAPPQPTEPEDADEPAPRKRTKKKGKSARRGGAKHRQKVNNRKFNNKNNHRKFAR